MNLTGTARTNYFRVKDRAAFRLWTEGLDVEWQEGFGDSVGLVSTTDTGTWPREDCEGEDLDFARELAEHLLPDSVAILMEVSHVGVQSVAGVALAIRGGSMDTIQLDMWSIYELVQQKWGLAATRAQIG